MQNLIIDEEFKYFLPALDGDTFAQLEDSIIQHGCRDALVLWQGILIDGYNRYTICTHHSIPFKTIEMEFDSREDALIWVITNQVSRRNLTPLQLTHFRGVHYRAERASHGGGDRNTMEKSKRQNDVLKISTARKLADKYKVSPRTIDRDAKTAAAIDTIGKTSPEAKRMILAGEAKIDRKTLKEMVSLDEHELSVIGKLIEDGTFQKEDYFKIETEKIETPSENIVSPDKKTETPGQRLPEDLNDLENLINKMTREYYLGFRELSSKKVDSKIKSALRIYIDMLEQIYRQI